MNVTIYTINNTRSIDMRPPNVHSFNALCGYPPKLILKKFAKVQAQFLLNFDPNLKIPLLGGEKLYKN